MKNLIKTSIATLLVFVMASSCKKEDADQALVERQITANEMANGKNEFDNTGKQHNAFLDYYAQSSLKSGNNADVETLIRLANEFYKNDTNDATQPTLRLSSTILGNVQEEIISIGGPYRPIDLCKRFPSLCNIFNPSPGPFIPFNILLSSEGSSTDRTLKFIDKIKSVETELLSTKGLKDDEKAALLAYYSTARHSAAYWHNNLIASDNQFWSKQDGLKAQFAKYPKDVIGADADGATIGGLLGTGFGPWGTVIGGVIGGAAASIWAASSK